VGRESEHPEVAWTFAKAHMKELLSKTDALGANSYAPGLFTLFSDPARIAELERYAKSDLAASAAKDVAKASDEVGFRADVKMRVTSEMATWLTGTLEKK
jgi:aminopeptidase N